MAGRFEGLSNLEWSLFEDIFPKPPEKRERGMPHSSFRYVLNTLLYILITGCRWCDVPFMRNMGIKELCTSMAQTLAVGRDVRGFTSTNIGNCTRERVNQLELWRGGRVFFPLERAVVMVLLTVEKERVF